MSNSHQLQLESDHDEHSANQTQQHRNQPLGPDPRTEIAQNQNLQKLQQSNILASGRTSSPSKQPQYIYLSCLPANLNIKSLFQYFSKFGLVTSIEVFTPFIRSSVNSLAVIGFESQSIASKIAQKEKIVIKAKQIQLSLVSGSSEVFKKIEDLRRTRLYIKHLPPELSQAELKNLFGKFEEVTHAYIVDKSKQSSSKNSKRNGFVVFRDVKAAERVPEEGVEFKGQKLTWRSYYLNFDGKPGSRRAYQKPWEQYEVETYYRGSQSLSSEIRGLQRFIYNSGQAEQRDAVERSRQRRGYRDAPEDGSERPGAHFEGRNPPDPYRQGLGVSETRGNRIRHLESSDPSNEHIYGPGFADSSIEHVRNQEMSISENSKFSTQKPRWMLGVSPRSGIEAQGEGISLQQAPFTSSNQHNSKFLPPIPEHEYSSEEPGDDRYWAPGYVKHPGVSYEHPQERSQQLSQAFRRNRTAARQDLSGSYSQGEGRSLDSNYTLSYEKPPKSLKSTQKMGLHQNRKTREIGKNKRRRKETTHILTKLGHLRNIDEPWRQESVRISSQRSEFGSSLSRGFLRGLVSRHSQTKPTDADYHNQQCFYDHHPVSNLYFRVDEEPRADFTQKGSQGSKGIQSGISAYRNKGKRA